MPLQFYCVENEAGNICTHRDVAASRHYGALLAQQKQTTHVAVHTRTWHCACANELQLCPRFPRCWYFITANDKPKRKKIKVYRGVRPKTAFARFTNRKKKHSWHSMTPFEIATETLKTSKHEQIYRSCKCVTENKRRHFECLRLPTRCNQPRSVQNYFWSGIYILATVPYTRTSVTSCLLLTALEISCSDHFPCFRQI